MNVQEARPALTLALLISSGLHLVAGAALYPWQRSDQTHPVTSLLRARITEPIPRPGDSARMLPITYKGLVPSRPGPDRKLAPAATQTRQAPERVSFSVLGAVDQADEPFPSEIAENSVSLNQEPIPPSAVTSAPLVLSTDPGSQSYASARYQASHLRNPEALYPPMSRRLGEEGRVLIKVFVAVDGTPQHVELHTSSGFARLDHAAVDAVARWRFDPASRGGVFVAEWISVPIVFRLDQQ